ncbi:murein hydrolase activator EnvC family protein [Knoellia sp. CPCC 206435]|uniref:murein hydrolase activator EnvC family protein n=1 Tax=Knoellia terrae TaxID=3404797 RepID=UPI003B42D813
MDLRGAIRRAVVTLGATGSLLPGVAAPPAEVARPASDPPPLSWAAGSRVDRDGRGSWSWPLSPRPVVLRPFLPPRSTYGPGHRGIDLHARQGQSVLAVDSGRVSHVGVIAGRGTVSVTHASGLRSTYEPVRAHVSTGAVVADGDVLGEVSGQSHCGGACLHLGALRDRSYVDPRPLLGGGPVILLPLGRSG